MKKFFDEYSFYAVKMFVNQFAVSLFGLTLSIVFSSINSMIGQLISSIAAVVFYLFLIYNMTWHLGYEDSIAIGHGKKEFKPFTGLFVSLLANSLNFILAILALCGVALGSWSIIIEGMYAGIMLFIANGSSIPVWLYFAIILPVIPVATISYYLGLKDKRIFPSFNIHKSSKEKK